MCPQGPARRRDPLLRGHAHDMSANPGLPSSPKRTGREGRTALSALNLRMVLAVFGLVSCSLLAWWAAELGAPAGTGVLAALALIAAIDLVVIMIRRHQRAVQTHRHYSLFE